MSTLLVTVSGAKPARETAAPGIAVRLQIATDLGHIDAAALRCQVQIEPQGREHDRDEQARLYDVFGAPEQWARTLRPLVWSQVPLLVPAFDGTTEIDLVVPCTYDLEVAAAKYLHDVRSGDVPLRFLFTGTLFRASVAGLVIEPVAWETEAAWRMPVSLWRDTMDRFFPDSGWVRVSRETLDALRAFRQSRVLVSWDDALRDLLASASAARAPRPGTGTMEIRG